MRGIYISNVDPVVAPGYDQKIAGQIQGFNKLGVDIDLICFDSYNSVILRHHWSQQQFPISSKTLAKFINNLLFKRLALFKASFRHIKKTKPNFLYLRHPRSDPLYLYFLNLVKRENPNLCILSEIPTYPYDSEHQGNISIKGKLLFYLDKKTRNDLKNYIDKIVVVSYEGEVFGIPSITIQNGITVNQFLLSRDQISLNQELHLIGVANVNFWHGYDRVIKGLKEYYNNSNSAQRKVVFHVVGATGDFLKELNTLTTSLHLSRFVVFYPPKQGESLDKIFEKCHVAIGTLANHRIGIQQLSPLKTREYTARGIPFIYSYEDPGFPEDFPYALKVPADESPINIQQVVNFAYKVYQDSEHPVKMREYAVQNLDWSVQMKKVVEVVKHEQRIKLS